MTEVVLFHSVYGLRPAVLSGADRLRGCGHTVHTPDLYEGAVFGNLAEARAYRDFAGLDTLLGRARDAVGGLPLTLVYGGFSMGAAIAQILVVSRPGARAALLVSGALPADELGGSWPRGVPAQIHYAAGDPLIEEEEVASVRAAVAASGASCRAFGYAVAGHLFADDGLPDFDRDSSEQMWRRIEVFLADL
jgi:dienelactone hydrolase